ncbi:hypothetical protein B9Z65_3529 [Elsinoe australis]|uniref:Uncharacterized protein n=1 Tax=Elsinoe australis TaxID=40998 RepID=A0A2P8AFG7_9PEZI|nr:hypothetical protein B9Z65_3529 [Elsinoe australis]
MGRKETKAKQRNRAREERINPGIVSARQQEREQVKAALSARREEGAEPKWGEKSCMEHHCPICQTPLLKSSAKRTCVKAGHVVPCSDYHEGLMRPNGQTCTACRQETALHDKRHREILKTFCGTRNLAAAATDSGTTPLTPLVSRTTRGSTKDDLVGSAKKQRGPNPLRLMGEQSKEGRLDMETLIGILHPPRPNELDVMAAVEDAPRVMGVLGAKLRAGGASLGDEKEIARGVYEGQCLLEELVREDLRAEAERIAERERRKGRYLKSDWYVKGAVKNVLSEEEDAKEESGGSEDEVKDGYGDGTSPPTTTPTLKVKENFPPATTTPAKSKVSTLIQPGTGSAGRTARNTPTVKVVKPKLKKLTSDAVDPAVSAIFWEELSNAQATRNSAPSSSQRLPQSSPSLSQQPASQAYHIKQPSAKVASAKPALPPTSLLFQPRPKSRVLTTSAPQASVAETKLLKVIVDPESIVEEDSSQITVNNDDSPDVTEDKASKNKAKKERAKAAKAAKRMEQESEDAALTKARQEVEQRAKEIEKERAKARAAVTALENEVRAWDYKRAAKEFSKFKPGETALFDKFTPVLHLVGLQKWVQWRQEMTKQKATVGSGKLLYPWLALLGSALWGQLKLDKTMWVDTVVTSSRLTAQTMSAYCAWMSGWDAKKFFEVEGNRDADLGSLEERLGPVRRNLNRYKALPEDVEGVWLARKLELWQISFVMRPCQGHDCVTWETIGLHFAPPKYASYGKFSGAHIREEIYRMMDACYGPPGRPRMPAPSFDLFEVFDFEAVSKMVLAPNK